jgi:hypothetical protein
MEAICSSETTVDTQRTTRRCSPEDGTLQLKFNLRFQNTFLKIIIKRWHVLKPICYATNQIFQNPQNSYRLPRKLPHPLNMPMD